MNKQFLFLLVILLSHGAYGQYQIPPVPRIKKAVHQYSELFNLNQAARLNQKLTKYADSTSTQIVVISIPSTNGEEIKYLAAQWGEKWGVGQKGLDNGCVILIAKDERKIAIQNGKGLEEFLTDALSKRIIEEVILPEFKNGKFYLGIDKGTDKIIEILDGNFKGFQNPDYLFIYFIIFGLILFFGIPMIGTYSDYRKEKRIGNNPVFWTIYHTRTFAEGGMYYSDGSSSGSGFGGGFGGGSFGGGGASGGW